MSNWGPTNGGNGNYLASTNAIGTPLTQQYNTGGVPTDSRWLMVMACAFHPTAGDITAISVTDNMLGTGWTLHPGGIINTNGYYGVLAWKVMSHADWLLLTGNPSVTFTVTAGSATQYNRAAILGDMFSVSGSNVPAGIDIAAQAALPHGTTTFSYTPASGSSRPSDTDQLAYQSNIYDDNFGGGAYDTFPQFQGAGMALATNVTVGNNKAQSADLGGVTASATPALNAFSGALHAPSGAQMLIAFGATFFYSPTSQQVLVV